MSAALLMRSWQSWWIGSATCHAGAVGDGSSALAAAKSATLRIARAAPFCLLPSSDLGFLSAPVEGAEHPFRDRVWPAIANRKQGRFAVPDVVLDRILDPFGEIGVAT